MRFHTNLQEIFLLFNLLKRRDRISLAFSLLSAVVCLKVIDIRTNMIIFLSVLYLLFTLITLAANYPIRMWEIGSIFYFFLVAWFNGLASPIVWILGLILVTILAGIHVGRLRTWISDFLFHHEGHTIPTLSSTEEEALNAGDPWFEKDLFMGEIDWHKLNATKTHLTPEEKLFLDHETEVLCSMLDEWQIVQEQDLPASVWTYMKENGFFGLVIDQKYGGMGFSARAHS